MTKPCRFCEGRDVKHGRYVGEADYIRCNTCGAEAPPDTWESDPDDWDEDGALAQFRAQEQRS